MQDEKISTSTMLQRLFKTSGISRFVRHYEKQMEGVPFDVRLAELCAEKDLMPKHVILNSGIERTYGYQLFNGNRTPSRDKVVMLAIGFGLDYDEAQSLLKIARKSPLYPKLKRDVVLIYAIQNKKSIEDIQATMHELGLALLGKEDRYD